MLASDMESQEAMSLIHEQANNINTLLDSQKQLLKYLEPDPFLNINKYKDEEVIEVFSKPVQDVETALRKIIENVKDDIDARNIPINMWNMMNECLQDIIDSQSTGTAVGLFSLRKAYRKITNLIACLSEQIPKPGLKSEMKKNLDKKIKEIERLIFLFDIHRVISRTETINNRLYSIFRSRNIRKEPQTNALGLYIMQDIAREIIKNFQDKANGRRIILRLKDDSPPVRIKVPITELRQALGNLLDNAIKYTGELPFNSKYENLWIDIKITTISQKISIAFENWGAPITFEEAKGDFVFKEGYRGHFARKLGVAGTGTGLADVRNFALKYGGEISYESSPVGKDFDIFGSTKTTVALSLPIVDLNPFNTNK